MGTLVALALRLLGVGRSIVMAAIRWIFGRWERPVMLLLAAWAIQYAVLIVPGLKTQVSDWKQATASEVGAHRKTKADYAQAVRAAEDKARANVESELERQDNENDKAVASYRAGTDDLDLRAERLHRAYDGTGFGSASCRPNLPATMARSGGVKDSAGAEGFSLSAGSSGGGQPAELIDPSMSIDERVRCTRYAHQLDAILDIDEANGEAAKIEPIKEP